MGKRFLLLLAFLFVFGGAALYAAPETAPAGVDAALDTDGDGMPDWWEVKYFGQGAKFNKFNGKMDLDGDKVGAADEYKMGTNPNDKNIDKNNDGVADDWMTFYGQKDVNADTDGDGFSALQEYEAGTDPNDKESAPKEEGKISQVHPNPSMAGVKENLDNSIPDNHEIRTGVFKYNDPIGDDKGPGYYTYPTNPVYVSGAFDIVSFEVDASGKENVIFKITVNADLKQDWGMAADFDVQHFQIYIDQDRVPGSGNIQCVPGLNVLFAPDFAWDKVVMITPQPSARVQIEVDVKAKDLAEYVAIPTKISGQGRTITAVVKKSALGLGKDDSIANWAWQLVAQSNEGFPDPDDVLTRNVNEYRGLHRIGGGSDYWGDPELVDIIVWPAKGSLQEATDQYSILNIWESYPDPKLDIRAVLPMVKNDPNQKEQWVPKGGYTAYAKELAAKIKPPAQKDKYVSDNFNLSTSVFTRWNWNLDPLRPNNIKNSLEVQFFGKAFTDKVGYYMRWEIANWDGTVWTSWENSTPAQEAIALQSFRGILVNPFPTVDTISIGNYELDYDPWVMGAPWYPDRDKLKGLFVDGTIEGLLDYHATVHYPLNWIGIDWNHGKFTPYDLAYGLKLNSSSLIKGLRVSTTLAYYPDLEISPIATTNGEPRALILRGYDIAAVINAKYKLSLPFADVSLAGVFAYSGLWMGESFRNIEKTLGSDLDGNGRIGSFKGDKALNSATEGKDFAGVATFKLENLLGAINFTAQGFYIGNNYQAIGAARGDTSVLASGFGGSPTADILIMSGSQSASRAPQAADFVNDIPIPAVPKEFLIPDPVTGIKGIGWVNDNWEGVSAMGWQGLTGILNFGSGIFKATGEFSLITYNNLKFTNYTQMRAEATLEYNLVALNARFILSGKMMTFTDNADITKVITPLIISPKLSYEQQLTKYSSSLISYKIDMGSITETGINATYTNGNQMKFTRHRIGLTLNYSMPVGTIRCIGEYWFEPQGAGNTFNGRQSYGAYTITEWQFAY